MTNPFEQHLGLVRAHVLEGLRTATEHVSPDDLRDAVRYTLVQPGKRVRPGIALAVGRVVEAEPARLTPLTLALEMIHTASLIIDDLPCMDDATERRGQPPHHVVFGEHQSIISAITLLAEAFDQLCAASKGISGATDLVRAGARMLGWSGLCGGQALDLADRGRTVPPHVIDELRSRKSGVLFGFAASAAATLGGAAPPAVRAAGEFGEQFGIAYQVQDDLRDGHELARARLMPHLDSARRALVVFGSQAPLLHAAIEWLQDDADGSKGVGPGR